MTNQKKRFQKIIVGSLKEYPFEWIRNFLEYYDYVSEANASSHFIFRRKNCTHITIVVHHGYVNQYYAKRMIRQLAKEQILNG